MSGIIITVCRDNDPEDVAIMFAEAGLPFDRIDGFPFLFMLPRVARSAFPFEAHPAIAAVEDDDAPVRGLTQPLTITGQTTGDSWALARLIRRRAPWPVRTPGFPAETFFRCARDGEGVDFHIVDTGLRLTHSEFGGRATNRYEFYSSGGAGDDNGHGTGVCSVGCGATNGLARASLIQSYKGLDSDNTGTTASIILSLQQVLSVYTSRTRPAVLNLSLLFSSTALDSAITDLINAGIVVVACAGNEKTDLGTVVVAPAESDPAVIVAGGTGVLDIPYYTGTRGTNWGSRVDVLAPSQNVRTALNTGDSDFGSDSGTSYGAACVAGIVACLLTGRSTKLSGRLQVAAVRDFIMATATTGRLRSNSFDMTLPDRFAYLDPDATTEAIPGL